MDWIKVETRLPDNGMPVLAATKRRQILIATYKSDLGKWSDFESEQRGDNQFLTFRFDPVTHWLHLPELPE